MSKVLDTYAVLMIDGDSCKFVKGGLKDAREAKKVTNETAKEKGNAGKVFAPVRIWAPVSFKEVTKYEFVDPGFDALGIGEDIEGEKDKPAVKKTDDTTKEPVAEEEAPKESVSEEVVDNSQDSVSEETADVSQEPVAELADKENETQPEAASAPDDSAAFDALFGKGGEAETAQVASEKELF
jgi:hypothetical protein